VNGERLVFRPAAARRDPEPSLRSRAPARRPAGAGWRWCPARSSDGRWATGRPTRARRASPPSP